MCERVDAMPLTASEAVDAGLIDQVLYEDELAPHVASTCDGDRESVICLCTARQASKWLRRPITWTSGRGRIGVVSLEGLIVRDRSRRIPVPLPIRVIEVQTSTETIIQTLRKAESDDRIVAVIFQVGTPGGSALASDLVAREVARSAERKPVIVNMGEQATSCGYYVSARAHHIVARQTTMDWLHRNLEGQAGSRWSVREAGGSS